MKILRTPPKIVSFKNVPVGGGFDEFNDGMGSVYMKIQPAETTSPNAVNLETGMLVYFPPECPVQPLKIFCQVGEDD